MTRISRFSPKLKTWDIKKHLVCWRFFFCYYAKNIGELEWVISHSSSFHCATQIFAKQYEHKLFQIQDFNLWPLSFRTELSTMLNREHNRTWTDYRHVCLLCYLRGRAAWKEPWERARKKVGPLSEHPAGCDWRLWFHRSSFLFLYIFMSFWKYPFLTSYIQWDTAKKHHFYIFSHKDRNNKICKGMLFLTLKQKYPFKSTYYYIAHLTIQIFKAVPH